MFTTWGQTKMLLSGRQGLCNWPITTPQPSDRQSLSGSHRERLCSSSQRCPQRFPRGESPSASHARSTLTHPPTERNAAGPSASPPSRSAEEKGSLGPPVPRRQPGQGGPRQEEKEKEEQEAARTSPPAAAGSPATSRPGGRSRAVRKRPERCRRGTAGRSAGRAAAPAAAAAPSPP